MKFAVLASLFSTAAAIKQTAANADAQAFLKEYEAEDASVVMPSGLMYKILKEGKGEKPDVGTSCSCHYEGWLPKNYPDGATFDSSVARGSPTSFAPNQVIKAWTEAMQMMPIGSKWELVCPPEIAYGSRAMGSQIPANSVLVFQMEMLSCVGKKSEI
jgi:FKBP-type peptidyl-prolyl cis-trans isomerase FklB